MFAAIKFSFVAQAILAIVMFVVSAKAANSAELVMFEQALCEWCELWEEEVGVIYSKTREGKRVPIRKVDIYDKRPVDLSKIKPVIFTPTFVLIQDGAEVGRILGYPGEQHFWALLNKLLEGLPADG